MVATRWFTGTPNPKSGANDGHIGFGEYLNRFHAALAKNAGAGTTNAWLRQGLDSNFLGTMSTRPR